MPICHSLLRWCRHRLYRAFAVVAGFSPSNKTHDLSLQCTDTVGWVTGRASACKKNWEFFCSDILTAALYVLLAPVVTTTSITLSSNKIQNGDILVTTNPGPAGKLLLKRESAKLASHKFASIIIIIFICSEYNISADTVRNK